MDIKVIIEKISELIDPSKSVINAINIATLNDGDEFLESKSPIILSIVNIEEDAIQKNQTFYKKDLKNITTIDRYNQPTQHIILSLLFSSYNRDSTKYLEGIEKLKMILQYFQQNKSFYFKEDNSELILYDTYLEKPKSEKENYHKITMEFVSLKSEELNQMWSYLGSKYMPSALYKMRFAFIQNEDVKVTETLIEDVKLRLWENDEKNPTGKLEEQTFKLKTEE